MPRVIEDYSDARNKSWCIHCGDLLDKSSITRDHTPSKMLLDRPFPEDLAITSICGPCNNSFSLDEEYFSAFISAVLSGNCDPDQQKIERAGKTFRRSDALRCLIDSQKQEQFCLFGESEVHWFPDILRFQKVILKNARAHLFYENGEPRFDDPQILSVVPIISMNEEQKTDFFVQDKLQPWCEVGSRWNTRLAEGDFFDDSGFLVVQPGVYRFRIEGGGLGVRTVIREYLATTVFW